MMVVRATVDASDVAAARMRSLELCAMLAPWGTCRVLKLERYYKDPREFLLYIEVSALGPGDRRNLLKTVANALASGQWRFSERNPEEARASWDSRMGGTPAVTGVTWLGLEFVPGHA